jgi:hypothetical protein
MNTITVLLMLYLGAGIAWAIKFLSELYRYLSDNDAVIDTSRSFELGVKLGQSIKGISRELSIIFFPIIIIIGFILVAYNEVVGKFKRWLRIQFNSKKELEEFKKYVQMVCCDLDQFINYGRIMTRNDRDYLVGVIDVLNFKKEFIRKIEKKTKSERSFDFDHMERTIRSTLKLHGWDM